MAKKRLNKKLVLILSLLASISMIAAAAIMLRQLQGNDPAQFEQLATHAEAAEDWEQAALFYHKAFECGGDPAYLVKRGAVALNLGQINVALQCWRDALIKDANLLEARRSEIELQLEMASLYNDLNTWLDLAQRAEEMIQADVEKNKADMAFAHHALGLALTHLGSQDAANTQRGITHLEQAAALNPENTKYELDLATQYLIAKRADEGRQVLAGLVADETISSADASEVRLVLARYLSTVEPYAAAEEAYEESIALANDHPKRRREAQVAYAVYLSQKWARSVDQNGPNPQAEQILDRSQALLEDAIQHDPDAFEPYEQLSFLYHKLQRSHKKAVQTCEARLARDVARRGVEAAKNRSSVFRLNIRASQACVALAEETEDGAERKAWFERAQQYLDDAKGEAPNHPTALRQEGELRLAHGQDRAALESFRAADDRYKDRDRIDWDLKKRLAQLHLKMREPGAAKEVLDGVAEQARLTRGKDAAFWLLYAQAIMETGDLDRALAIVDPMLLSAPDLVGARQIKASILERKGEAARAGTLVDSIATAAILQAKEYTLNGNPQRALKALQEAHTKEPGDYRLTGTLVAELVRRNRNEEAEAVIERAKNAHPNSDQIKALAVWIEPGLSGDQRDAAVLKIIKEQEDAFQRAIDLMDFYLQREQSLEALTQLRRCEQLLINQETLQAQKATVATHRGLIRLKMQIGSLIKDESVLEEARRDAVQYDVDGAGGQTVVGMFHMLHENWQAAATAFRSALQIQATDARSLTHLGECLVMLEQFDDARTQLERALHINPKQRGAHRGLARVAKQQGDTDALQQHLRACKKLIPNDPWVRAELLYQEERLDPAAAIARREDLFDANPDDLPNLRRLAALCAIEGLNDKADRYYAQLLTTTPADKQLVVLASSYYRSSGRPEMALALVQDYINAQSTPTAQADAQILLASHYVNIGDAKNAESTLLHAADTQTTLEVARALGEYYFNYANSAAEALVWFKQAETLARADDPSQLPTILGALVECLLDRSINDPDRAQEQLDALLARFPQDRHAPLLQSEIHSRNGDIDAAIRSLSQFLNQTPENTSALFHRAKHYIATGQAPAAISDLQAIKRINPTALDLRPRLLLASLHFQSGRRDLWILELESILDDRPDSEDAIQTLVAAYVAENRFQDADRLLTEQINRHTDRPQAQWFASRGTVAFALKDYKRALRDFLNVADLTEHDNDAIAPVLDAHLALGNVQEATAYFETHADIEKASPALLARYGRLLVMVGRMEKGVDFFRRAMDLAVRTDFRAASTVAGEIQLAFESTDASARFREFPPDAALARANDRILTRLYALSGDTQRAEQIVLALLDSCKDDRERVQLLEEQGDIFNKAGKPESARNAYEQALKINDQNWVLLNNLAFLLADAFGDPALALPYARKAAELAESTFTLDTLGWIYVGLGDFPKAIAELNQALRLDPGAIESYYHLGEAYRLSGQFAQAASTLARAKEVSENARTSRFNDAIENALKKTALRSTEP